MISLRWKLAGQLATLFTGAALLGAAAIYGLNGLHQSFTVALDGYQLLRKLYDAGSHVQISRVLLNGNPADPAGARLELERARALLDSPAGDNSSADDTERDLLKQTHAALDDAVAGKSVESLDAAALNRVLKPLIDLVAHIRQRIQTEQSQADLKRQRAIWQMSVLFAGVAGLSLVVGVVQYRSVMTPLRRLQRGVERLGAGEFQQPVPTSKTTEFAELAQHFNRMAGELSDLYRDLRQKVDEKSKQLVRNQRLANVGLLAAGVAHEINNPLNIITANAELSMQSLKKDAAISSDEMTATLKVICDEAYRCTGIVQKLLTLARRPLEPLTTFSLGDLVRRAVAETATLPACTQRTVRLGGLASADLVSARPDEIKQVFLNLLYNALEATEPGGTIEISVAVEPAAVQMIVRDNGKGMSAEMLEQLFQPFFTDARGKTVSAGEARRGTGLGLAISHAIARRYGGDLRAASPGGGLGTTMTLSLPPAEKSL